MYLDSTPAIPDSIPGSGNTSSPRFCLVSLCPLTNRPPQRKLEPLGANSWSMISTLSAPHRIDRNQLYVTNLMKVPQVAGKSISDKKALAWEAILIDELVVVRPERILAIGDQVATALCGPNFKTLKDDHGSLFISPKLGIPVIPTYPMSSARNPAIRYQVVRDLEKFFTWAIDDFDHSIQPPELCTSLDLLPWDESPASVVLDIETAGLELDSKIHYIGLQFDEQRFYLADPTEADITRLGMYLADEQITVIGQNLAFDVSLLMHQTPHVFRRFWRDIHTEDTMLMAHNRGREQSLGLKHMVSMYTNLTGAHTQGGFEDLGYLSQDLEGTKRIHYHFRNELDTFAGRLTSDLVPWVSQVRVQGVHFDRDRLATIGEELDEELAHGQEGLFAYEGAREVNFNAPAQVAQFLLKHKVPLQATTKTGNLSVAESVLLELAHEHELPQAILDYRAKLKLQSGFVKPYLTKGTSFVHPRLILEGAITGRLSCRDPNLQQIPRTGPFKSIFTPRRQDAVYGLVDLAQAELRVAAFVSQDEVFADALLGEDVHRTIASMAFAKPRDEITAGERKASKAITFGLLYGGSSGGLAKRAGLPKRQVEDVEQNFMAAFPKLGKFMTTAKKDAEWVEEITTLFGRRRDISIIREIEGPHGAFRKMVNTPIQSVASDIMLSNVRYIWRKLNEEALESKILFGVHDSLLMEIVLEEEAEVVAIVQEAFRRLVDTPLSKIPMFKKLPMVGELVIGAAWAECESTSDYYAPLREYACSSHG